MTFPNPLLSQGSNVQEATPSYSDGLLRRSLNRNGALMMQDASNDLLVMIGNHVTSSREILHRV